MPDASPPVCAYLSFGSNLGDREKNLDAALRAVFSSQQIKFVRLSGVYNTEPVEVGPGHPHYLNCVAETACSMPPMELLRFCQGVEAALERDRKGEMAPRTVDIDILLYGDLVLDGLELRIPHRGIERPFNLKCLSDLDGGIEIPGLGRVRNLLTGVDLAGVREHKESSLTYGESLH